MAPARRFLQAQFGDVPFALVFADVDEGRASVGREASREVCSRAGIPALDSDLVGENYESTVDAVRSVARLDREPDPYHDVLPVTDAAGDAFEETAGPTERTSTVTTE